MSRYWLNHEVEDEVQFREDVRGICKIYHQAQELHAQGIHVISVDEKTGIQALERIHATHPAEPGQVERVEFEYERHVTQALIANFEVATGKVVFPTIQETRTVADFLAHIQQTVKSEPQGTWIFVADQLNTHKSASLVKRWISNDNLQTVDQRTKIPDCRIKKRGALTQEIAKNIGTSEPTISRELKRNTGKRGYRPKQAHIKALWRKKNATKAIKMTAKITLLVNQQIRFDLSPEQLSGWLLKQHGIRLSHARIYQHIWADKRNGGDLYTHLRQAHKKHRKKYGSKDKRGQIRNRVSIKQRPDIVEEKSRIGDWEIGTIIGQNHKGALVTIVERKTKFVVIKKVDTKHAETVSPLQR